MSRVRIRFFWLAALVLVGASSGACQRIEEAPAKQEKFIINGQGDLSEPAIGALTARRSPFCTGTLLTKQLVVTAAHCVEAVRQYGITNVEYRVDFPAANGTYTSDYYQLDQAVTHPKYSRNNTANYSDYDIAVLVLKTKANNVTPITPNTAPIPQALIGKNIRVVGYGQIQTRPSIVSADKKYAGYPTDQIATNTFIHFDQNPTVAQRKSACHGDSGGPALTMIDGKWVILGVTSTAYRASFNRPSRANLLRRGSRFLPRQHQPHRLFAALSRSVQRRAQTLHRRQKPVAPAISARTCFVSVNLSRFPQVSVRLAVKMPIVVAENVFN